MEENLPLVKYVVKRFSGRGRDFEDLYQYGCIGLVKAVDRFDPAYDVAFSTYAVPVIMGEVRRFLRGDGILHVARSIRDNARKIERAREEWEKSGRGDMPVSEIVRETGISPEDAVVAIGASRPVRSLDEPVGEDGRQSLSDVIGHDVIDRVDLRLSLAQMLKSLSPEEKRLIAARYFSGRTQSDIACEMGISQVQVSRMESRIIGKLRCAARSEEP